MKFIVDSNIVIYSYEKEYGYLRSLFSDYLFGISAISRVEILGFHGITLDEELYFKKLFTLFRIVEPSTEILDKAIEVRRQHNLKLGDSLIAATGLIHDLPLYTRNTKDFERITALKCINPVK